MAPFGKLGTEIRRAHNQSRTSSCSSQRREEDSKVSNHLQQYLDANHTAGEYEIISHLPYKRTNSYIGEAVARGGSQSQRSNSQGEGARPPNKQVRFDIRESLKNMIEACDEDQPDHDQENNQLLFNREATGKVRKLAQTKKLKPQARLKFQRPNPLIRARDQEECEMDEISRQKHSERSPMNTRQANRRTSCESSKNSDSQKPRKTNLNLNKQLALTYKRNADEMRRKKYGIEPTAACEMVMDDTNYSSVVSISKNEESRETPNFSQAPSRRDLHSNRESADSDQIPPLPMQLRHHQQQTLQVPPSIESETMDDEYEELNYNDDTSYQNIPERAMGTIIRNHNRVPNLQQNYLQSETSVDSCSASVLNSFKPGTIIRQRSQSPSQTINLSNFARKHSTNQQVGAFVRVGSIIRNQSQQVLSISDAFKQPESKGVSFPVLDLQRQQNFHYLQTSPGRSTQSFTYIPNMDSSRLMIESPTSTLVVDHHFRDHQYGTIWNLLQGDSEEVKSNIYKLQEQSHYLRIELLQHLGHTSLSQRSKLQLLRTSIVPLVLSQVAEEAFQLLAIKEKRDKRLTDLQLTLSKWRKNTQSQHEQLKSELLRDIVQRLNQKLTLSVFRLRVAIKRQLLLHFDTYHREYILKSEYRFTFDKLVEFRSHRSQQREYLSNVKNALQEAKTKSVFIAWSQLKSQREQVETIGESLKENAESASLLKGFNQWKIHSIGIKNKALREKILEAYRRYRLREQLFLRWVSALRQTNKIKRKALNMMVSNRQGGSSIIITSPNEDASRLKVRLDNLKSHFKLTITEYVQELQYNEEMALDIGQSKIRKVASTRPTRIQIHERTTFSSGQCTGARKLEDQPIDIRRSLNIDTKYQIHSALVMVQNSQHKSRPQSNSNKREPIHLQHYQHFVSDGVRSSSTKNNNNQYQTAARDRVNLNFELPHSRVKSPAPNKFFSMLEDKINNQKKSQPLQNYNGKQPLQEELRIRIRDTLLKVQSVRQVKGRQHLRVSLLANANDVINKQDFKEGITDYIQYGIASAHSRQVFQNMFETKTRSQLFTKWRKRFLQQQLSRQLADLNTLNVAKRAVIEWHRAMQQRLLWAKDFHRTRSLRKFYKVFQVWSKHARQEAYKQEKLVRTFRKKTCFEGWARYLSRQGHGLMNIIKAQNHHHQVLLSKSLISIYRYHLQCLRVKNFRNYHCFRVHFKQGWVKMFNRQRMLKKILKSKITFEEQSERDKYRREYDLKKETVITWKQRVSDKLIQIQMLSAATHCRQTLVAKTFFHLKKLSTIAQACRKLQALYLYSRVAPALKLIANHGQILESSEATYKNYRKAFQVTRVFNAWKEHLIHNKLIKFIQQKRIIRKWHAYVWQRNHLLPIRYREKRVKRTILQRLYGLIKSQWNEKRSDIMVRQLVIVKRQRVQKIVFLKLLENLLRAKKEILLRKSTIEFKAQKLTSKAFRLLKRKWLKRKKRRLVNMVARDFSESIQNRRDEQLRESLLSSTNDLDILRLRDLQVFEDPKKMLLFRVINSWKMFIQDKLRRDTVIDRYLLFKRRMTSLRCFLSWRSIAKYEQSSSLDGNSHQKLSGGQHLKDYQNTRSTQSTKLKSKKKVRYIPNDMVVVSERQRTNSVRFALDPVHESAVIDTRTYLFNNDHKPLHHSSSQHSSQEVNYADQASATFGQRSVSTNNIHSPLDQRDHQFKGTSSLFDELEGIFQKNRKWLDDQREREEFLKEMASHYNTRLSHELMSSLHYSNEHYPSLTMSLTSRK